MIKTGKHYKLVSNIGKCLGIGALVAVCSALYHLPNALVNEKHKNDILKATEYSNYVTEQTQIYDYRLQNNEISKEEYSNLCKALEDEDAFIKQNGTPLQIEYYNLSKSNENKHFTSCGIALGISLGLAVTSGVFIEIADEMEKKYQKYMKNYKNLTNVHI